MRNFLFAVILSTSGCTAREAPQDRPQPPKKQTAPAPQPKAETAPQAPSRPGKAPSEAVTATKAASPVPSGTWERTRAQGVQLARMCVNEDSRSLRRLPGGTEGKPTIDHKLIAQTVLNRRKAKSTFTGWLDVMKWLSPHVGRVKESKRHRHDVNAHLPANGDGPPFDWIDCRDVAEGERCDGDWRVHGPYWVDFRERMVDLWLTVDRRQVERELGGARPMGWGNEADIIRRLKNSPDRWCVIGMGERNFFIARPGHGCELNDPATVAARKGLRP